VERLQNPGLQYIYLKYILVAGGEVDRRKPNPKAYLKCLEKSRVLAEQTIEDSIAGVKAGVEASILSLGIEHESDDARSLIFAGTKKVIMPPDNIPKALKYFE